MIEYEKINTLWKRDSNGEIIEGDYSKDEFKIIDKWTVTEKVDGQCITIVLTKFDIDIFGKTAKTQFNVAHEQLMSYIKSKITREVVDNVFDFNLSSIVTLYGEGYGPKIQSGGQYGTEQKLILFDIRMDDVWLEEERVNDFAEKLGLQSVPIIGESWSKRKISSFVHGNPKSVIADCPMEGVVCRSNPLLLDRMGRRVIFKLKVKDFKVKSNE